MSVAAYVMVKNEEKVITRCLQSLRGLVDCVALVDTGSTDSTLAVVRALDFPVPIHIYQRPWKNFGHNRTEASQLAASHAEYVLRLDADMTAEGSLPARLPADCCNILVRRGILGYWLPLLVRSTLPWRYEGVTHEYLTCDLPHTTARLESLVVTEHADSIRNVSGRKYTEDAELLEAELARDPSNERTVFYLARSYDDLATIHPDDPRAGEWRRLAAERYRQRTQMGGYTEEAFYSLFRLGALRLADGDGLVYLLEAWQRCPHRWEPVEAAARWLNERRLYEASYALTRRALAAPPIPTGLFVHQPVFDHLLLFEHSISAYWVGSYQECWDACQTLLGKKLPQYLEEAVRRNMAFAQQRLDEQAGLPTRAGPAG